MTLHRLRFCLVLICSCWFAFTQVNTAIAAQPKEALGEQLIAAAMSNDLVKVKDLLERGVDADYTEKFGYSALMVAAFKGHADIAEVLLARGADTEKKDKEDAATALIRAAQNGHPKIVAALIQAGAQVNVQATSGVTALVAASFKNDIASVQALLDNAAQTELRHEGGRTALHTAARTGHTAAMALLLSHGADIEAQMDDGRTPLIMAALHAKRDAVEQLLSKGADPNHASTNGATPLIVAAEQGQVEIAHALIAAGAAVNHTAANGGTALMGAAYNDHTNVVRLLLKHGADAGLVHESGKRAIDLAKKESTRKLLRQSQQPGKAQSWKIRVPTTSEISRFGIPVVERFMQLAVERYASQDTFSDSRFAMLSKRFLAEEGVDDSFMMNDYGFEDFVIGAVSGNEVDVTGINRTHNWERVVSLKLIVEDGDFVVLPSAATLGSFLGKPSNYVSVYWKTGEKDQAE